MQLDAEEDGQPIYKPSAVAAAPSAAPTPTIESIQKPPDSGTGQEAAATATVEQEE